ncbi:hypothetical protein XA68_12808 [Ophiocordyceps unilateralis]|uniref:Uncharacterized protein n=1 Tax=Ophiocordyceps unilateralis TaxID=268505 RepID=A0A2A9PDW8_OPHUN|nr:hypothetical protein XA68_12808 [Ophiocordyceps unilateralis]
MDDSSPLPNTLLSALLNSLAFIFRSLVRIPWTSHLVRLVRLILLPSRLLASGLARIASLLAVLFAPALYIFVFLLWVSRSIVALIVGLEPLYKFFSVAATMGIFSGIFLAVTSSLITNSLGMHDEPNAPDRPERYKLEPSPAAPPASEGNWFWAEPSTPSKRRQPSGLLSQTIHEEDSDT